MVFWVLIVFYVSERDFSNEKFEWITVGAYVVSRFECQNVSCIMIFATERNHQRKDKRWVTKEGLCSDHYFSLFHSKAVPDWQHDACQTAPIVVLDRTNTGLSTNPLLWPTSYLFFDGVFLPVSFVSSTFLSTVLKLLHSNNNIKSTFYSFYYNNQVYFTRHSKLNILI